MSGNRNLRYVVKHGGALQGEARVPGDKSISHRSIMLGALADGVTEVEGFLEGDDCLATLSVFQQMGVRIDRKDAGGLRIHGVGIEGLTEPANELYLGNSGTSMRLLAGLLSGQRFDTILSGDDSLSSRPMRRVINPLLEMGARLDARPDGTAPLAIRARRDLKGIEYRMPVASAQVKSCLLLAGLYASGQTTVYEPAPTRDHTERMLMGFGYKLEQQGNRVSLHGGGRLQATSIDVPADISSAAFFLAGASIADGSDLTLRHVGINPTRIGVINILRQMGASIEVFNERTAGGEPVADLRVRSAQLRGIHIPEDQVPLAIDEFPAIFIAAACADGETVLTGAEELRVKESDRIAVMAEGMQRLGVDLEVRPDGMVIRGGQGFGGGIVQSHGDHRIAMAFAMAALRASDTITINNCENVDTSFPGFAHLTADVGLEVTEA